MFKNLCPAILKKRIILASSSPRRKEVLQKSGLEFECISSNFDESSLDRTLPPDVFVTTAAEGKAQEVFDRVGGPDTIVIGSDTMILFGKEIFGKPKDHADAKRMLTLFSSGRPHEVFTGVTILAGRKEADPVKKTFFEVTKVYMRQMSEQWIDAYLKCGESMDKAGAYGLQDIGCCLVEKIDGDFFNVVGLPLARLCKELHELVGEK